MLTPVKALIIALIAATPVTLHAQYTASKRDDKKEEKKDTKFTLLCPFENGSGRVPKEAFSWDPPDHKVVLISQIDTVVRSSVPGEVVTIQANEEGMYDVVVYYSDHYFWYSNIQKPRVALQQKVVAGQSLGTYKFGVELELRVYKEKKGTDETDLLDPREWLDCKIPKD